MEFSKDELQTILYALDQLLSMHISADYEVEAIRDRIDGFLRKGEEEGERRK